MKKIQNWIDFVTQISESQTQKEIQSQNKELGLNNKNNSTTSQTVVIGDSIHMCVIAANPRIGLIKNPRLAKSGKHLVIDAMENYGGESLINLLKKSPTFGDVKNLILTIGSNDLWKYDPENATIAINLIKKVFPRAKLYILNGNWGWGGLSTKAGKGDEFWLSRIQKYIRLFQENGFTALGQPTKVTVHPAPGDKFYKTYEKDLQKF